MKLPRRTFLRLAAGATALPVLPRIAMAQAYPMRSVRIMVGFAAGGAADIVTRLMGQWLVERLGQSFVIENRLGAAGNIATETVVRATPDGYTLLLVNTSHAINSSLDPNLSFNFFRDIAPVAGIIRTPLVMHVNPAFPAKTTAEFIAYAKANPGKINMASPGNGTGPHMAGELFKMMAGLDMVHVPYRGGAPAITDLLGGQVQVLFEPVYSSTEHIKAGKLRALGVTSATRLEAYPNIPTVGEIVPGFEASAFFGLGAPKDTPGEIVDGLNKVINAGLADPKMKARFVDLGGTVLPGSPDDFRKLITEEIEKWGKVARFSGAKPG